MVPIGRACCSLFFTLLLSTTMAVAAGGGSSSATPSVGGGGSTSSTTSSVSSTTTSATGAMTDLSLTTTVNPTAILNQFMGVTYTFAVRNNGPSSASSVTVADAHPSSLRWEGCEAGCVRVSLTQIFCNFGTMASGAVRTSRCRFTPTAAGNITNTADVFSTTPDPNSSNNRDSATVQVPGTVTAKPVSWTSAVGVRVSANSLTKSAATAWGNAGAVSSQQIASGDGYVQVSASETSTYRMIGLSRGNSNASYGDIDFAVYLAKGGQIRVYEAGTLKGSFGSYLPGDAIRVAVAGSTVKYSKNGVVFYTSKKAVVYPLLVDTALYSQNATLISVLIYGAK